MRARYVTSLYAGVFGEDVNGLPVDSLNLLICSSFGNDLEELGMNYCFVETFKIFVLLSIYPWNIALQLLVRNCILKCIPLKFHYTFFLFTTDVIKQT